TDSANNIQSNLDLIVNNDLNTTNAQDSQLITSQIKPAVANLVSAAKSVDWNTFQQVASSLQSLMTQISGNYGQVQQGQQQQQQQGGMQSMPPPQQQGGMQQMPPPQQGYPSSPMYPPTYGQQQQPMYPAAQQGYPSQQVYPGYGGPQQMYPPSQQQAYYPQQSAYPAQQQAYYPQQAGGQPYSYNPSMYGGAQPWVSIAGVSAPNQQQPMVYNGQFPGQQMAYGSRPGQTSLGDPYMESLMNYGMTMPIPQRPQQQQQATPPQR
ncbi:hypothetical protein C9374_013731, partial [Naegleria lovaniensis]